MFGIIGSGFGLYGHLPAIAAISTEKILVPDRYIPVFEKRNELKMFESRIIWVNEMSVLDRATAMTFSTWPQGQGKWLAKCLTYPNIKQLVLEKPLGVSPLHSKELLTRLIESGKNFRINYAFINTRWFSMIKHILEKCEESTIKIKWDFMAYHYQNQLNNWKRSNSEGGGGVRFFGIHFIAILIALNFNKVIFSETTGFSDDDVFKWTAKFVNTKKFQFEVELDSYSKESCFKIEINYRDKRSENKTFIFEQKDPFTDNINFNNGLDVRVEGLKKLYTSLNDVSKEIFFYAMYKDINTLWGNVEQINNLSLFQKNNFQ